jgi:enoyl-CoA hydratase
MVWALYGMSKPVVAAIGGHAVAGGCVLALTADYRVLGKGANIGLNEVRVGVPLPWTVTTLLKASVRPERLSEVALLGKNFADEEAVRIGLVQELAEDVESASLARLSEFVERDARSLTWTKQYLRAQALADMKAHEAEHADEWLGSWFSDSTRARLKETVAALGRPK